MLLLVVLLLGAWIAWQVWHVNKDLNAAVDRAKAIQAGVDKGDTDVVGRELPGLRAASARADDRTSGFTWRVLTKVPFVGDDAKGVQVTSEVLDDLARDGVAPLADAATGLDRLLPRKGSVDVEAVRGLQSPVAAAQVAFVDADRRLSDVDSSGFMSKLDMQFTDFRRQVARARRTMDAAKVATEILPDMLGGDGRRHFLLAFQNNAEARSLGGLPGAVSYIQSEDGKLSLPRHVTGGTFPVTPQPILPLSAAEQKLYGEVLGTYFVDANMSPDLPRAAALMKAHSESLYPHQPVDGVVLVDTVAMSYLLEATGPVTVDGVRIGSDNVVDELLHNVYLRLDGDAQDKFFADVSQAVFEKVTDGIKSPGALIRALSKATEERRLFVHSFDDAEQAKLAGSAIAGEFVTDPTVKDPQVAVTVNDTTGSKMSYYLRYDVDVQPTSCVHGVQTFSAKARLHSTATPDVAKLSPYVTGGGVLGVPPGDELVTLRIFGPTGGRISDFQLNAKPMNLVETDQDGRPAGMTYLQLGPGQTFDLSWTMMSGRGQVGDTDLTVTPGVGKGDSAATLESACR